MDLAMDKINHAAEILRGGGLVAFASETVYGLGGDATNCRAVAAIYRLKRRPRHNPLIVHVADFAAALRIGEFSSSGYRLAQKFWPGPLTILCKLREDAKLCPLVTAGGDQVAIRVPGHGLALAFLRAAGCPVAAPSVNRSGRLSATRPEHIRAEYGDSLYILDGGVCSRGIESTIISVVGEGVRILRPGAVSRECLVADFGVLLAGGGDVVVPGRLAGHYAPRARLRLNVTEVLSGEALLAFGCCVPDVGLGCRVLNLSSCGDLCEAASNLFSFLHLLDLEGYGRVAVMPVPCYGVGEAINDRLLRASLSCGLVD